MNYLAIDTSGKNLTIIIKNNGKIYKVFDSECGVNHSVELMPRLEKLALDANFDLSSASFFAVVVGPGSFTGIRIGVATVKALCFAYKKPYLSITSFDTLAYNEKGGSVLTLIDAKHNGFYACGYLDNKVNLAESYLMREEVLNLIDKYDKVVSSTIIDGISSLIVPLDLGLERAIESNLEKKEFDISLLTPLYVRKSQAEEGR